MTRLVATIVILALMCGVAFADTGKQADMTISIDMSKMAEAFGALFGDEGGTVEASPDDVISLDGKLYWGRDAMLVEMESEGEKMQTLVDYKNMVSYELDPQKKKAYYTDLKSFQESLTNEQGLMPGFEFMFNEWDSTMEGLAATPGATVEELAPKMINGVSCQGAKFVLQPPEQTEEKEPTDDPQSNMFAAMFGSMGPITGEVWYSDDLELPLVFNVGMFMMDMSMNLSNVADWDIDPARLSVPDDYELVEMNPMAMYEESAKPAEANP